MPTVRLPYKGKSKDAGLKARRYRGNGKGAGHFASLLRQGIFAALRAEG
jgi:hypothetical protein